MYKKFLIITIIITSFWLPGLFTKVQSAGHNFTLTWSASSYTPPEYQGKALPTQGSQIKVVAAPLNSGIDPEKMTFRWLLDDETQGAANGPGKNYFVFPSQKPAGAWHQIEVQILDVSGNLTERQFLSIKIRNPEILISDEQNNYLPQTISVKTGQTLKLSSAPLFFNVKTPQEINFSWTENDRVFSSALQTQPEQVSIQIAGGKISQAFTKTISANVAKKTDDFERAAREITLEINQ